MRQQRLLFFMMLLATLLIGVGQSQLWAQCSTCSFTAATNGNYNLTSTQTLCVNGTVGDFTVSGTGTVCVASGATWNSTGVNFSSSLKIDVFGTFNANGNFPVNGTGNKPVINVKTGGVMNTNTGGFGDDLRINNDGRLNFTNTAQISNSGTFTLVNGTTGVVSATATSLFLFGTNTYVENANLMTFSNLENSESDIRNAQGATITIGRYFYNHGHIINDGLIQTICGPFGSVACEFIVGDKGPGKIFNITSKGCMKVIGNTRFTGPGFINGTLEITGNLDIDKPVSGTNGRIIVNNGVSTISISGAYNGTNMKFCDKNTTSGAGGRANGFDVVSANNPATTVVYTVDCSPNTCTTTTPICSVSVTATPTTCVPATNQYTVNGNITLTNNTAGGTATVSDGARSISVPVAANATSVAYSLTGLISNGASHTVVVSLPGCGSAIRAYLAPTSCTAAPPCSVSLAATPGACVPATNKYTVTGTVNFTSTPGGTLTITDKVASFSATVTTVVSVSAGQTSASFSLTGLTSGGRSHTITATFSNSACSPRSMTYLSPVSCNAAPCIGTNLLLNPSFEQGFPVPPNGPQTQVPPPNWIGGTADNNPTSFAGADGYAYGFSGDNGGTMCQSVSASVAGTYNLTFYAGVHQLNGQTVTLSFLNSSSAVVGSPAVFNQVHILESDNTFGGPYSLSGVAPAGTSQVRVCAVSGNGSGYLYWSKIDNLCLTGTQAICKVAVGPVSTSCNPATNQYTATGTVSLTNATAQTLTITDGAATRTLSVSAGQTSASFSLTGTSLISNQSSHTLTVTSVSCGSASAIYSAPASCTPAVRVVVTTPVCNTLTNNYTTTGTVSLTNATTGTLTITDNGNLAATISVTAGQTTANFTLTGVSGSSPASRSVVAMLTGTITTIASTTYAVPASCTIAPQLAVSSATVCAGKTATLSATGCLNPVAWSTGTTPSSGTLVTVSTANLTGITSQTVLSYTATCTIGNSTTTAVATVTVSPLPSLSLTASPSATATVGNSITLTASGCAGGTVNWSTNQANTMSIVVSPALGSTVYSATCTTPSGCTGTASITVVGTAPLTAGLGDKVFEDLNANGIQDTGEPGIPTVTVTLFGNGTTVTTTTNGSGIYSFTGLTPGVSYTVGFSAPTGYSATVQNIGLDNADSDGNPTTGITGPYSLSANEFNSTVDMGYIRPASLGDKVFADNNSNGIQDTGDSPIPGVTVVLYINGVASATTTTASSGTGIGCYSFTGLTPGSSLSYSVGFGTPTGYTATTPNAPGSTSANDSDVSPVTGRSGSITLSSGQYNPTLDAGYVLLPVASLRVSSATVCAGATASLSASGCTGTVTWSTGTSPSSGTLVTVSTAGLTGITSQTVLSYTATCTVGSSVTTAVATVTVNPLPSLTLTASPSQTVTAGNSVTLTATGCAGGMVNWSTNQQNLMAIIVNPATGANSYSATCTTPTGCTGTASIILTGLEPTTLVVTSVSVCAGQPATLMAMGCKTGVVTWSVGTSPSSGTLVSVSTAGLTGIVSQTVLSYTATCTNGTVSTAVATVTVNPVPSLTITASPGEIITAGGSVTLTATGCAGGLVNWSTNEQNQLSIVVMAANTVSSTIYSATCITPGGCSDTQSIEITTVAAACNVAVTAVPGTCEGRTTLYVVTGQVSATGSVGVTSVTVSSGSKTTVVSLSGNGPTSYTLSGLAYVAGVNTVTVMSSASACGMSSVTYTAPESCSVAPPVQPTFDITKVVNTTRATLGDVLSYTVTLVNTSTASGSVVATDVLDSKLSYVPNSAVVSAGSYAPTGTGGTWTVASLPGNATATLTFSASVLAEGIVYNTASIDSKTVSVCTSIPVRVCAGSDYAFSLSVATGMSRYQWYKDDVLIQDNGAGVSGPAAYTGPSANAILVTTAGAYRVVVNEGVSGQCPDLSCCPFIVEEVSLPVGLTLTAVAPTCIGTTPQTNGKVVITGLGSSTANVGLTYQLSTGGMSFSASTASPVPAGVIPGSGEIVSNAVGGITYFVRVYGVLLADGTRCSVDLTVVVPVANCACPAEVCVPISIRKTKALTR